MPAKKKPVKVVQMVDGKAISETQCLLIGRNDIPVDPNLVAEMAEMCCTNIEIAHFFGIPVPALARNFEFELTSGRDQTKRKLRKRQLDVAMDADKPNPTMLIWLGKQYLGQQDSSQVTVNNNTPEDINTKIKQLLTDIKKDDNV